MLGVETLKTEVSLTAGPGTFIFPTLSRLDLGLNLRPNHWPVESVFSGIRICRAWYLAPTFLGTHCKVLPTVISVYILHCTGTWVHVDL